MGERLLLLTTCACCAALAAGCDVTSVTGPVATGPVATGAAPAASAPARVGEARARLLRTAGHDSGKLRTPRRDHAAVLLGDGRVLLVGGEDAQGEPLAEVELYEPLSGSWSEASPLLQARSRASAVLLADGRVLVSGGLGRLKDGSLGPLQTQELYDPGAGTWEPTGPMSVARADHSATRLLSGRVFLAGGQSTAERVGTTSAELFAPELGENLPVRLPMASRRFAHSALRLPSGDVLIAGGDVDDIVYGTAGTELFQPDRGEFLQQGPLADLRFHHTATLLHSGSVGLVGGRGSGPRAGQSENSTFVWSAAAGTWAAGPLLQQDRESHTAALLPSGRLLVAGGWDVRSLKAGTLYTEVPSWELVATDGLSWQQHPLLRPRARHSSTLLPTGQVLLAGGEQVMDGAPSLMSPTELLEVADDAWLAAPGAARAWATLTLLLDGRVLVLGESVAGSPGELLSADGASATPLPPAPLARGASATLLESGAVLLVGGEGRSGEGLASAMLLRPQEDALVPLPAPLEGRARHSATLLPNGNVLVAGGHGSEGGATVRCELFDPMLGAWREVEGLAEPRAGHSATLLPDGRVLLAGGTGEAGRALHSVALFDPRAERWTHVELPGLLARESHAALLAADGSVLLVGGMGEGSPRTEIERVGFASFEGEGYFVEVVDGLPEPRLLPTLTLLLNGRALVSGGSDAEGNPSRTALLLDGRSGRVLGPAAPPPAPRGAGAAALLLPDGRVLHAGGGAAPQRYDEGRGAPPSTRPVLDALGAAQPNKEPLEVTGRGLTGVTEASGGTPRSAATDVPLLLLRRADGSLQAFASTGAFSATAASARLPLLPGGPHWVYPITNAAVGVARPLQLGLPRGAECRSDAACASGACAGEVCCDHACDPDSCGGGTCLARTLVGDGGVTSRPGIAPVDAPVEPPPGPGTPEEPDAGGLAPAAAPPRFASSSSALRAQCAQLFVSAPEVQGDGPFAFALAGEAPEGLALDEATGELRWSPTRAQAGHHLVQRVVRTPAGEDVQTLELDVACEGVKLAVGCGCRSGGEAGSLAAAGALLVLLRRRRRRGLPSTLHS